MDPETGLLPQDASTDSWALRVRCLRCGEERTLDFQPELADFSRGAQFCKPSPQTGRTPGRNPLACPACSSDVVTLTGEVPQEGKRTLRAR